MTPAVSSNNALQNPADRNRKVRFIKWDAERRPREDMLDLEDVTFNIGEFQRVVDNDLAVIDWELPSTDNGDEKETVRSLHYVTEFEEYKIPIYKTTRLTPEEDRSRKIKWLQERNLVAKRNAKNERYFVDTKNRPWSTTEVNRRYQAWDLATIVMERLAIIVTLDSDFASTNNQVGFNKFDSEWGHKLYTWFNEKGFWTIPMLEQAIKLVHRYRKQIELHAMAKELQITPLTDYHGLTELQAHLGKEYLDTL